VPSGRVPPTPDGRFWIFWATPDVLKDGALEECGNCLMRRSSGGVVFTEEAWSKDVCLEKTKAVALLLLGSWTPRNT
jgi:hypothetical protein